MSGRPCRRAGGPGAGSGLTFGTGSHATTRLCLTTLEDHPRRRAGTGPGLRQRHPLHRGLKLGAASAAAVDIDNKCRGVAYENAALNGIGQDTYTVRMGDVLGDAVLRADLGGGWQMVVANIVADVIIGLSRWCGPCWPGRTVPLLRHHRRPGQEVADRLRKTAGRSWRHGALRAGFPISAAEQELEKRGSDLKTLGRLDGFLGGHMAPVVLCCVALGIAFPEVLST